MTFGDLQNFSDKMLISWIFCKGTKQVSSTGFGGFFILNFLAGILNCLYHEVHNYPGLFKFLAGSPSFPTGYVRSFTIFVAKLFKLF